MYFFDLPVVDVTGSVCDALRYMYHGCFSGAFGQISQDPVDLDEIKAIKVRLSHKSAAPLSEEFEYHLVFYRKELANSIWNLSCRKRQRRLRSLSRRVVLSEQPTLAVEKILITRRLLDFFTRKPCDIYFTRYDLPVPPDYYVPVDYHQQLLREFTPYIMRSPIEYPLVRSLFQAQNLPLDARQVVKDSPKHTDQVIVYKLGNHAAPATAKPELAPA